MTQAHYLRMGALNGLSAKETLLMRPGQVFDLFDLYLQANGAKKRDD